jgi:hypothetical protein
LRFPRAAGCEPAQIHSRPTPKQAGIAPAGVEREAKATVRPHHGGSGGAGRPKELATQVAARTVNYELARSGQADTSSRSSTRDISSVRRGGLSSHRGTAGRTKVQLNEEAPTPEGVEGRSKMSTTYVEHAVGR